MDFETQIENFNDEMLEISRKVKKIQERMSELYYGYLGVRILKWGFFISSVVVMWYQLAGAFPILVLQALGIAMTIRQRTIESELNDLTDEYDDKVMEVVSCQEKKMGLAEVWEKQEEETLMNDEKKQEEYNNNMPSEEYVLRLLTERASLQLMKEQNMDMPKEKGLRKMIK